MDGYEAGLMVNTLKNVLLKGPRCVWHSCKLCRCEYSAPVCAEKGLAALSRRRVEGKIPGLALRLKALGVILNDAFFPLHQALVLLKMLSDSATWPHSHVFPSFKLSLQCDTLNGTQELTATLTDLVLVVQEY